MARKVEDLKKYIKGVLKSQQVSLVFRAKKSEGVFPDPIPDPVYVGSQDAAEFSRSRCRNRVRTPESVLVPRGKALPSLLLNEDIMLPDTGNGVTWLAAGDLIVFDQNAEPHIVFRHDAPNWEYCNAGGERVYRAMPDRDTFAAITGVDWRTAYEEWSKALDKADLEPFRVEGACSWGFYHFTQEIEARLADSAKSSHGSETVLEFASNILSNLEAARYHEGFQALPELDDAILAMQVAVRDFIANGADKDACKSLSRKNHMIIRLDVDRDGQKLGEIDAVRKYILLQNASREFADLGLGDLQSLCLTMLESQRQYKAKADEMRRDMGEQPVQPRPASGVVTEQADSLEKGFDKNPLQEKLVPVMSTADGTLYMTATTAKNLLSAQHELVKTCKPGHVRGFNPSAFPGDFKVAWIDSKGNPLTITAFNLWNDEKGSCVTVSTPNRTAMRIPGNSLRELAHDGNVLSTTPLLEESAPQRWWNRLKDFDAKLNSAISDKIGRIAISCVLAFENFKERFDRIAPAVKSSSQRTEIVYRPDSKQDSSPLPGLDMSSQNMAAFMQMAGERMLQDDFSECFKTADGSQDCLAAHTRWRSNRQVLGNVADLLEKSGLSAMSERIMAQRDYLKNMAEVAWAVGTRPGMEEQEGVLRFLQRKVENMAWAHETPIFTPSMREGLKPEELEKAAAACRDSIEYLNHTLPEERGHPWHKETIEELFMLECALREDLGKLERDEPETAAWGISPC